MRVGGAVTVVMGLAMLGLIRPLQAERRLHVRPTGRYLGAPLLGAVFAFGWTVCLGPTLVGVLSLANATDWGGPAWRGVSLVVFYCAGLGIPFLLLALGFGWAAGAMGFLRRHTRTIQIVGAVGLIVLGTLMLTGVWGDFIAWLQGRIAGIETVL
jgi:cytochrome c-type biogenesis protein